jgi:hypothetical protein
MLIFIWGGAMMELDMHNEKLLSADIERLRQQFPQTQDLYREVCVLMFFRHGITPTANKLYQLVRKGSMSAPAEALNRFWENLRDKSRVTIEHPDLPQALKTAAGELVAALWSNATESAHAALASCEFEAKNKVAEAELAQSAAQAELATGRARMNEVLLAAEQVGQKNRLLEQSVAALTATNGALSAQLQLAKEDCAAHLQRLQDAGQAFTLDLDKLRAASKLADERSLATETRALLEVDRGRVSAARLQKELDAVRSAAMQAAEQTALRHRQECAALQAQFGDQRQQTGMLEGHLQAITGSRDAALNDIKALQAQLADAGAKTALQHAESESWRRQAQECQHALNEARSTRRVMRTSRTYRK